MGSRGRTHGQGPQVQCAAPRARLRNSTPPLYGLSCIMRLFRWRLPVISFEPCLPRLAKAPPTGPDWIHEIKHDGFRIIARRDGDKVRLISRNGKDLTYRFPLVVKAVAACP